MKRRATAMRSMKFAFVAATLAVVVAGGLSWSYDLPPDLTAYFKARYEIRPPQSFAISSLKGTPDGPRGNFNVGLSTKPMEVADLPSPEERGRAAARAFLLLERDLLDIRGIDEIMDKETRSRPGKSSVFHFQRQVNGIPLQYCTYSVTVEPDLSISMFAGTLVPTPAGLFSAAMGAKITAEKARDIVGQALAEIAARTKVVVGDPVLEARWIPPYVVWEVRGTLGGDSWYVSVDAVSGEIARTSCGNARASGGVLPAGPSAGCDGFPRIDGQPAIP